MASPDTMIYGPTPIRHAASREPLKWTPCGPLGNAPAGRDPNILVWDTTLYLTVCGGHDVRVATSEDFENWTQHGPILTMAEKLKGPPATTREDLWALPCGRDA